MSARLELELVTDLRRNECIRKLEEVTRKDALWHQAGAPSGFLLRNDDDGLRIRASRARSRSGLSPLLYLDLQTTAGGTRVRIRLRTPALARVFLASWFGAAIFGPLFVVTIAIVRDPSHWFAHLTVIPLAWVLPLVGYVLMRFGDRAARKDGEAMVTLVKEALRAREVSKLSL